MKMIVKVAAKKGDSPVCLSTDEDGWLSLGIVKAAFPGCTSLTCEPVLGQTLNIVEKKGRLHPLVNEWGDNVYICQFTVNSASPLFFEDAVCRVTKNKDLQYGMVIENAEFYSDDETGSDDSENLKEGFVKVAWYPKGEQETVEENKLILADRSLMPGDVISSRKYGVDKIGYCKSLDVRSGVKVVGSNRVILDVKSEDLRPIEDFSPDLAAYYNGWVGMIKVVELRITARSSNNVVYRFHPLTGSKFRDLTDRRKKDSEFRRTDHYPGQILGGNYSSLDGAEVVQGEHKKSTDAKFKRKSVRLTVEKVEVESLRFRWQCQAHAESDSEGIGRHEHPPIVVAGEELKKVKMLNVFEPETLQLGDRNFYTWRGDEKTLSLEEWQATDRSRLLPQLAVQDSLNEPDKEIEESKLEMREENGEPIASSSDYEDVDSDENASQASTSSSKKGKRNCKSSKCGSLLSTKVLRKRKLRRSRQNVDIVVPEPKPGDQLVVECLGTETRVTVVWQDGSTESDILSRDIFPVHYLDEQEFFPGDFVIGSKEDGSNVYEYGTVKRVNRAERTVLVSWFKLGTSETSDRSIFCGETEVSAYDVRDHPDYKFRPGSCVIRISGDTDNSALKKAGQVLDNLPEGKVLVWWVDGSTSECDPQQLYRVGDYDSEAGELWDDQDDLDRDGSWSTESESELKLDLGLFMPGVIRGTNETAVEALKRSLNLLGELAPSWKEARQYPEAYDAAKELVMIYKTCRPMDTLLTTSCFSESVFGDLIEKVKNKLTIPIVPKPCFQSESSDQYDITPILRDIFNFTGDQPAIQILVTVDEIMDIIGSKGIDGVWSSIVSVMLPLVGRAIVRKGIQMQDGDLLPRLRSVASLIGIDIGPWSELFKVEIDTISAMFRGLKDVSCRVESEQRDVTTQEIIQVLKDSQLNQELFSRWLLVSDSEVKLNFKELNSLIDRLNETIEQVVKPEEYSKVVKYYKRQIGVSSAQCGEFLGLVFGLLCALYWLLHKLPENSPGQNILADKILELISSQVLPGSNRHVSEHKEHKNYLCRQAEIVVKVMNGMEIAPQVKSVKIDIKEYCRQLSVKLQSQIQEVIKILEERSGAAVNGEVKQPETEEVTPVENGDSHASPVDVEMEETLAPSKDIQSHTKKGTYSVIGVAPLSHWFDRSPMQPKNPKAFLRAVKEEILLLSSSLPEGIHVRSFEDRTVRTESGHCGGAGGEIENLADLFSVMIEGPKCTPYEDGLFFFDFQLPANYPLVPPVCHYYAYCKDRLNPNLYEEGKVCVSLLGTWNGKGSEVWNPGSNLLQVLVSIQGLILNSEPYYNEAGYERQRGSAHAHENSRLYNEMVFVKMAQSMVKQFTDRHDCFKEEVADLLKKQIPRFTERLKGWIAASSEAESPDDAILASIAPDFPLLPLSKGFTLAIQRWLAKLEEIVKQ